MDALCRCAWLGLKLQEGGRRRGVDLGQEQCAQRAEAGRQLHAHCRQPKLNCTTTSFAATLCRPPVQHSRSGVGQHVEPGQVGRGRGRGGHTGRLERCLHLLAQGMALNDVLLQQEQRGRNGELAKRRPVSGARQRLSAGRKASTDNAARCRSAFSSRPPLPPLPTAPHLEARVVKVDVCERREGGGVQEGIDLGGHFHTCGGGSGGGRPALRAGARLLGSTRAQRPAQADT